MEQLKYYISRSYRRCIKYNCRIQGLCNTYEVDILISGDLVKQLDAHSQFQIKSLGENELRGRDEKIELFTILSF